MWCCGSLGLGHPAHPQTGHRARPHLFSPPCCLQLPPRMPQDAILDVSPPHIKHPALGSQGGIWELLSLEETASPEERAVGWPAPNPPLAGHTGVTEQAATVALAVSQAGKTSPAPKRASSFFRSHSHHQHSPCSAVGMALGTPPGTLLSVPAHLCAEVALKSSCVLRRRGGLCCHSHVTKPGGEKGGSASHPGLPQTAPERGRWGCRV